MGLPTSGAISLNQMHTEVGGTSDTQLPFLDRRKLFKISVQESGVKV